MPHSDISGSKPACGSPKLFAVDRVLLRLLAPRHPPYALIILTFSPLTFPPRAPRSVVISAFHHKKRLTLVFSSLYAVFKEQSASWPGGDERVRTAGLLLARQALSQLSYTPKQASDLTYHRGPEDDTGRKRDSLFFASLTLGAFAPLFFLCRLLCNRP